MVQNTDEMRKGKLETDVGQMEIAQIGVTSHFRGRLLKKKIKNYTTVNACRRTFTLNVEK